MGKPNKYNEACKYILKLQIDIDKLRKRNIELNNEAYKYKLQFKRACLYLNKLTKGQAQEINYESIIEKEIEDESESMDKK